MKKRPSTGGAPAKSASKINPALEPLAVPLSSLRLDERNARKHDKRSIEAIRTSLSTYGQQKPIVALSDGTVIAGNGTLEAARSLKWDRIAVVMFDSEDEARARAFAIVDNRSAELATWDDEVLSQELSALPGDLLGSVGFDEKEIDKILSTQTFSTNYTRKIEIPVYEPKNKKPSVESLCDPTKAEHLKRNIESAELPSEVREFLLHAAARHVSFNFSLIADFYAHSDAKTQRLFEESALVIVDFDRAIENGFVKLTKSIAETYAKEKQDA